MRGKQVKRHLVGPDRSLVKLVPLGLGRAQRPDGTVAVTYLGPEQAVWPHAQSHQAGGVPLLLRNSVHLYQTGHQGLVGFNREK